MPAAAGGERLDEPPRLGGGAVHPGGLTQNYRTNVLAGKIVCEPLFELAGFDSHEPPGDEPQGIAHGNARALGAVIYGKDAGH